MLEKIVLDTYPEIFKYLYQKDPSANLFQSLEGIILLKTMDRLAYHNLPAIPVHDCLLVQKDNFGVAEILLKRTWKEVMNVDFEPEIEIKMPGE